jgi:hypothetical protein
MSVIILHGEFLKDMRAMPSGDRRLVLCGGMSTTMTAANPVCLGVGGEEKEMSQGRQKYHCVTRVQRPVRFPMTSHVQELLVIGVKGVSKENAASFFWRSLGQNYRGTACTLESYVW